MIPAPNRMAQFRFSTRGLPLRECAKSLSALHDRKLIEGWSLFGTALSTPTFR